VTAPPIECEELTKRYGRARGVEDITLRVETGSITGFLGPNGAGKTTLLRLLGGLLRPTHGSARIFGVSVDQPAARRRLGYLPADPVFARSLSGYENLDLLAALQGTAPVDRAWAAERLDLPDAVLARAVRDYSSGMVQKLALVQALQHRPDLVLLDEPANRLDPIVHHAFEEVMREISAAGRTVLLSSHTLSDVDVLCDQVAMIDGGHLVVHTTTRELTARAPRRVTIRYRMPPDRAPRGLLDPHLEGASLRGRLPGDGMAVIRAIVADPVVTDVLIEPATLEDVFLGFYGQERATP
jgi:ABC-2 type transport system ATP-binding protein